MQFSWYTDRAVLGVTYHATQLYWITDKSREKDDTWAFLDRHLRDSHTARKQASDAYKGLMNLSDATASTLSTLIRSTRRSY